MDSYLSSLILQVKNDILAQDFDKAVSSLRVSVIFNLTEKQLYSMQDKFIQKFAKEAYLGSS
jgi:hypothetical protein